MKRYAVTLTNKNGSTISRESDTIEGAKRAVSFFPLSVFFGWIYDRRNDEMIRQNTYTDKWRKCNKETFVGYY